MNCANRGTTRGDRSQSMGAMHICTNHWRAVNAGSIVLQQSRPSWLFMQPTLGSNTATTQLNTSQHAVQCFSTLLSAPRTTLSNTALKPSAQQPTLLLLLLHHLHPLVPPLQFQLQEPHIVAKHGRISTFQRSTFQTSLPSQYPLSRAITAKHHCSSNRPTFSWTN